MPHRSTPHQRNSRRSANNAGLRFVADDEPGISRRRRGKGFKYFLPSGAELSNARDVRRVVELVLPPAWTDVWICSDARGHIQATGRDAKGRKQYRYHADWQRVRDENKYGKLIEFARALPDIRATIAALARKPGLGREKVLAVVVSLLETTLIRVGNQEYARQNKSFGLTTLQDRHVDIEGGCIRFQFKGKTGKEWKLDVRNARVARIVRSCQELPGQHLFQYEHEDGSIGRINSADVNDFIREIAGADISAKDFRTWAGTVLATMALREFEKVDGEAAAKKNIRRAIEAVASRLGNTPTICRKCYVHPEVLNCYLEGSLIETLDQKIARELKRDLHKLPPEEAATLALLHKRLGRQRARRRSAPGQGSKRSSLAHALRTSLQPPNSSRHQ